MTSAKPIPIDDELEQLWAAYIAARSKCEQYPTIQNGIEAGYAWAHWLARFEGSAHG